MPKTIDPALHDQILAVVHKTIANSNNRDDLWKLAADVALEISAFVQSDLFTFKVDCPVICNPDVEDMVAKHPHHFTEKPGRIDLATKLGIEKANATKQTDSNSESVSCPKISENCKCSEIKPTENRNFAKNAHVFDDLETPRGYFPTTGDGPIWMAKQLNLAEYWVYDYSSPCITDHGKNGKHAAQTEIWLVHRRKYKLVVVDVEFDSLKSLQNFLDPRKELARKNNITPLEKIDEELAGKEETLRNKCRDAKKQSQFNRFIEYYHQFNGDAAKISAAMGIQKQSVYAYKNKAKDMGVLK